jgi:hypothetical protein
LNVSRHLKDGTMRTPIAIVAAIAALVLGTSAPAFARGHGGFRGPPGFHHGVKAGWGRGHVPPGWHHGRKVGWDGGHAPPGLRRR